MSQWWFRFPYFSFPSFPILNNRYELYVHPEKQRIFNEIINCTVDQQPKLAAVQLILYFTNDVDLLDHHFIYVYTCVSVQVNATCQGGACRSQRRASDPLEPELQVFRAAQHRCWQLYWGLLQEVLWTTEMSLDFLRSHFSARARESALCARLSVLSHLACTGFILNWDALSGSGVWDGGWCDPKCI